MMFLGGMFMCNYWREVLYTTDQIAMLNVIANFRLTTVENFLSTYTYGLGSACGAVLDNLHEKGTLRVNSDGQIVLTDEGKRIVSLGKKRIVVYHYKDSKENEHTRLHATRPTDSCTDHGRRASTTRKNEGKELAIA